MLQRPIRAYGFQFFEKASILIFLYLQSKNKGILANRTLIKARTRKGKAIAIAGKKLTPLKK